MTFNITAGHWVLQLYMHLGTGTKRRQIFRSNFVGLDAPMHLSATVKFWGVRVPRKRLCRKAIKLQLQLRFRRKMLCMMLFAHEYPQQKIASKRILKEC